MSRRGFTIAESLFSAVILSLVMMAIFYLFPSTALAQRKAELRLQAGAIANSYLEAYRAHSFDTLMVGAPAIYLPTEEHAGVTFAPKILVYQCGADPKLLKGLRVTVEWSYSDQPYSMTLESWVSSVTQN